MTKKWTGERLETFIFNETAIEHLHRYAIAMEYVKDKVVLDIACGEGYGTNLLATLARQVTGVDLDAGTITNARKKYRKNNIEFIEGRAEKIPVADSVFDIVVSFETLEHLVDHDLMLAELKRVLKPGGLLIISTPDKKHYSELPGYANPFHLKELYAHEFESLVRKHFSYSHFLSQALATTSLALGSAGGQLRLYEGNYEGIQTKETLDPLYLIAIASDSEMSNPPSSLFLGRSILQTALEEKAMDIRNTWSYRIGHFVLWPLKRIRAAFRKTL